MFFRILEQIKELGGNPHLEALMEELRKVYINDS